MVLIQVYLFTSKYAYRSISPKKSSSDVTVLIRTASHAREFPQWRLRQLMRGRKVKSFAPSGCVRIERVSLNHLWIHFSIADLPRAASTMIVG